MFNSQSLPLDNVMIQLAYAVIVAVAWAWAISQVKILRDTRDPWHVMVALWMVSKAVFFTFAGMAWWIGELYYNLFLVALVMLAATHLVTFTGWLRQSERPEPIDPRSTP